jgi:hypothetical protein
MLLTEFLEQSILAIRGTSFAGHVGGVHNLAFERLHGLGATVAETGGEIIEHSSSSGHGTSMCCILL